MPPDIFKDLGITYGIPVAFAIWVAWDAWRSSSKVDPSKDIIESLHDLRDRMVRVETILEERK